VWASVGECVGECVGCVALCVALWGSWGVGGTIRQGGGARRLDRLTGALRGELALSLGAWVKCLILAYPHA